MSTITLQDFPFHKALESPGQMCKSSTFLFTFLSTRLKDKTVVLKPLINKLYYMDVSNLPTTEMLTVALFPVPTMFNGTQVYTPSATTVTLNTPEVLLPIDLPLK